MRKKSLITNTAITATAIAKNIHDASNFEFQPDLDEVIVAVENATDADLHQALKGGALNAHTQAQTILATASDLPANQRAPLIQSANALTKQMLQSIKLMQNHAPLRKEARIGYYQF